MGLGPPTKLDACGFAVAPQCKFLEYTWRHYRFQGFILFTNGLVLFRMIWLILSPLMKSVFRSWAVMGGGAG